MTDLKISEAIKKLASGYSVSEVTREYAEVDGALKLVKKRETKKDVPPDMKAILYLMETDDLSAKSEEELEKERENLEKLLKESQKNE